MIEAIVPGAFSVIMLIWNLYLMRQNGQLVNKLMSRNYSDYIASESYVNRKSEKAKDAEEVDAVDPYDEQRARDLNAMLGMG